MSIIHRDWTQLKKALILSDPKVVEDKKIGIDKTLVISIQDLKYNRSIPILKEEDLEKWIESRIKGKPFRRDSVEDTDRDRNNYRDRSHEKEIRNYQNNENDEIETVFIHDNEQFVDSDSDAQQCLNNQQEPLYQDEPEYQQEYDDLQEREQEIYNSGKFTDELVINEQEDDEFAKFKDDDDDHEETQMSRNLKKIRSKLDVPKPNEILQKKNPAPSPTKVNVIAQNDINITSTPRKSPIKNDKKIEPVPSLPEQPAKPDWPETDKCIQQNQLEIAYRDLNHFKDHINSDEIARPLLLELVKKCLQEDETLILTESLNLIYNLGFYNDEVEFWSELLLRLKRKLIVYDNVKNFKFKTKANPTQIHDSYKTVLLDFSEHAKKINQTFKLPVQAMSFLLEPLKVLEPQYFKPCIDIKPKIEPQKVEQENHQQQNNENINLTNGTTNGHHTIIQNNFQSNDIHHTSDQHLQTNQPNQSKNSEQSDQKSRKVFLIHNKFGKESFKILMAPKTIANSSEPSTSSSLDRPNDNIFRRRL